MYIIYTKCNLNKYDKWNQDKRQYLYTAGKNMNKKDHLFDKYKKLSPGKKSLWKILAGMMAVIVTFVTTYSLILPAITVSVDQFEEVPGLYLDEEDYGYEIVEDKEEMPESSLTTVGESAVDTGMEGIWDEEFIEDEDPLTETESELEEAGINPAPETGVEPETQVETKIAAEVETEVESESETKIAADTETADKSETGAESEIEFAAETETEFATEAEVETEAETEVQPLSPAQVFYDRAEGIRVIVNAPEGAFPEGTTMTVNRVEDKEILQGIEQAAVTEATRISRVEAVDICFLGKDGEEIEPQQPISVRLVTEVSKPEEEAIVVHMDDNGQTETFDDASVKTKGNSEEVVSFEAEHFSVYAVVYTVDFHYEVNGKMFEFSIPGGGFASFYKIVEVLGIARIGVNTANAGKNVSAEAKNVSENDENTADSDACNVGKETGVEENDVNTGSGYGEGISLNNVKINEATREFVADIASVEFSNPEFVWVGKVDEATTVGGLKEANGLEVQYSAELTEEQITEINGTVVESGDWVLFSMLPFASEERLTVTMKNGETFTIRVMDAQTEPDALRDSASETTSVTVNKEWYDGNTIITDADLLEGLSARVQLVRYREENSVTKVHLCYARGKGDWVEKTTTEVPQESNVSVHIQANQYIEIAEFDEVITDKYPYDLPFNALGSGTDFNVTLNTVGKSDIYLVFRYNDATVSDFSYVPAQGTSPSGPVMDPTFSEEIVRELNADNNWEATFADLPSEGDADGVHYKYSYGVREISNTKGYMFSNYGTVGVNESDSSSNVPASLPASSITMQNIKVQPGTLRLLKTSDYDGADAAEKTYRIALKDQDGIYMNQDGTEAEGTDPVWIEFKNGDEKTWNNIPAGKYTIEEEDASVEGLSWTSLVIDASGDISKDNTVTVLPDHTPTAATVSNTYSEPVDISLVKTWDSNVSDDMAWEATFVLEELEYLYDSSYSAEKAHDDADHSNAWEEVKPRTVFTVSNDSEDIPELSNLPRFRTGEDGKKYILMYSVTETGYKVWANADKTGDPVYQWSVGEGYRGDVHFTPEYVEDADEYTNYTIEIINSEKNETENIFIDFDLTKIWAPEGDSALTDNSYAIFQLKRMSHQEFKDMNDPEVDYSRFVTVRIVDAAGREISSCEIEKNAYIKLQAGFKSGIDGVGTVEFENLDGSTGHVLIENGSALASQALVSSQPFRIDSDATFQCISGENYLADGIHGVVISDRCDGVPTADKDDETFNNANYRFRVDRNTGHIVSYSNGTITDTTSGATAWKLDFQDFPQTMVDIGTVRQTTTVYGYYFEEVESSPNWKAYFYETDAAGNKTGVVNGDSANRIYFNSHVIAENKKPHLTIKKYWESLLQSEMPNVVIEIKQVTSDGNNINVNDSSRVYKRVILTAENNFEYDMYNFPVRNGSNSYYAYVPIELGTTACKPGDEGVDADGTITDISEVVYEALDSARFGKPTYILAKDGDEINYVRIKADSLDRTEVQNFDQGIKQSVVSTGTGTVCIVNNPVKFPPQMDIRKRWHKFTDAGGMTTESDYNGAYFTAMIVQIVKNAEPGSELYGKEIKRKDYGTEFEWHYNGNNSFHYYDAGHEGNVSIDYHNGTWHVTIHEGSGHDGSNLPLYGYYTDANGIKHLAEYDYTFREVSITSTDGYHWALSDHIQESSQQGSSGHQFFLDNYPDADLKIVKHWPNKPEREGTTAVYFKITDGDGNNVLKDIAEKKRYREHQLNPADLVEYNGEWCLVVKGSAASTDDWIGYIDHLDLFDFSETVFENGNLPAGAMPGKEMSYNVTEVAVVRNGETVSSSDLYIPYYQVTTRGTKGSIRSSATGIHLGMNVQDEDGNWYLQPTIVEVTNNSTTDLEVEKRFYEKETDRKPVQVDPSEMTEWINEDGTSISRIDYVVKVDTYLTATDEDSETSTEEPVEEMSGYLTEGWKTGGSLAEDITGAAVFSLDITAEKKTESTGVYWSSKPDALKGLPSAKMVEVEGGEPLVYRYVYTIIEKGVYAGENEVTAFSQELEHDSNKGVWKLNNIRTKDEYTPFEFTKEWQNSGSSEPADWPDGKSIIVTVTRTKNSQNDADFDLKYTITSQNKENTEISADSGSTYPDGSSMPKLQYQAGTKYTYKLENLLKKHGSDEYVYTLKETGTVEGYVNQNPDGVTDKGKIINKKAVVDISVLKVDDQGDPLDSAVFRLQKKEDGTYQNIKFIKEGDVKKYPEVTGIGEDSSFTSGTTMVTIGKLPDGEYRLVEDSTKAGYLIIKKEIDFTITDGVIEGTDVEGVVEFTKAGEKDNTLALITITNTPGVALPSTGGPGTRLFTILGSILILLSGTLLWRRRRWV